MELTEEAKTVLRRCCQWHLGDEAWADEINEVIDNPVLAADELNKVGAE